MWRLLNQPYPCEESTRERLIRAAWIGVFVALFLLLFQPFGLTVWQTHYKELKILGYGLVTFIITATNYVLTSRLIVKQYSDVHWTVGREIAWVVFNIFMIAVGNLLYAYWLTGQPFSLNQFVFAISTTFLIGIFPTAGSVILTYIIRLRRYARAAAELPIHEATTSPEPTQRPLTLTAENGKDTLVLLPSDLLFIESSDNYSTVFYLKNDQPTKVLLRSSLSRLESQIEQHDTALNSASRHLIVRCHRSYIANLDKVEKITGNAQGYKLHLYNGQYLIPVARKYNESFVSQLKAAL